MTLATAPGILAAGIGELVVSGRPDEVLAAYGLGSCVALVAWDATARVGALAHFMLPAPPPGTSPAAATPAKFVESGIEPLLAAFRSAGGDPGRATFRAAGGAAMLALSSGDLAIGRRNAEALSAGLAARGLRLAASDLGGSQGRTVQLEVGSGRLLVRSLTTTREL
ncbi:MAG TPA: chemotaxis protein CheD [Candidatus Limnocylindrales bacterium]